MEYLLTALILGLVVMWFIGTKAHYWASVLAVIIFLGADLGPVFWLPYLIVNVILLSPELRKRLVSVHLINLINKYNLAPKISETEKTALRAGTIWVDGEFFQANQTFLLFLMNIIRILVLKSSLF